MTLYLVDDHKLSLDVMNRFDNVMSRYGQEPQPGVKEVVLSMIQSYVGWNGGDGTIDALETVANVLHGTQEKDAELLVRQAIAILLTNKP